MTDFASFDTHFDFVVRNLFKGQIHTIHFANIEAKVARNGLNKRKNFIVMNVNQITYIFHFQFSKPSQIRVTKIIHVTVTLGIQDLLMFAKFLRSTSH